MDHLLQFSRILLVLMLTVGVNGREQDVSYNAVGQGQSIVGQIEVEITVKSNQECSLRCLGDQECTAYQYKESGTEKCILIHRNCSIADGQTFRADDKSVIYSKVPTREPGKAWMPPLCVVLYENFDNLDGLILRERETPIDSVALVTGKVNQALSLNRARKQWADLGIHTEACMTRPETCGAAGGALTFWLNTITCLKDNGIITSRGHGKKGFIVHCTSANLLFDIVLWRKGFRAEHPKPSGWTHLAMNYIGPKEGEGIRIYYDGVEVARDSSINSLVRFTSISGKLIVGRAYYDYDTWYSGIEVDELFLFNHTLSSEEIEQTQG